MKKILFMFLLPLSALQLSAQEESMTTSSELVLQVSSLPEAKLGYTFSFRFPVLQGESDLTKDNNLKLHLTAEITPVSLNGIFKAVLTPIAFLEFSAGARAGAGWNINLFGSDIYGNGLNMYNESDSISYIDGKPFDALLWKAWLGGTFQFDLAAIIPGEWNHVVFLTYHEINYHANTRAAAGEAWYFEADDGENFNTFNYYGNIVLGYQMPIFLNMVAFMAEMDYAIHKHISECNDIGLDLMRWKFSNILNFIITEKLSIALITQLRTRRNFTNFDEHTSEKPFLHFTKRILDTSDPVRLEFYRIAAIVSYKF
ncbi:MAG: hypothetical protein FWB77_02590 [Treponema sp.]|nr:hypothetical protein [Treponema sp.]